MCNCDRISLSSVVMMSWSSSEKVEKVCVLFCHPPAPWNALLCLGVRCVAVFLAIFRAPPTHRGRLVSCIAGGFFPFFFFFPPTEGKQMRSNVNSRLLMQHCAKMCAPAARMECAASPSILHGGQLRTGERVSVQTEKKRERERKKTIVHTHSCVHTCDAILSKHRGLPPTLYQF